MLDFRHEQKYIISETQMAYLKSRLGALLRPDPHAGYDGCYNIRSIYFDDLNNTCFYENENGTDPREKFRIRIYNNSPKRITLECKRKQCGMTQKQSCLLTKEQFLFLANGKAPKISVSSPFVLQKLCVLMETRLMRPVVIVNYDRMPFICATGNVRVTFDKNIASSQNFENFFSENLPKRPVMPTGKHILEVKWDEFLPDYIYDTLAAANLNRTTYSKFYLCRKFPNS
jgi:hypothetical protein